MEDFDTNDMSVHLLIFKQLKDQYYKEGAPKSQLERLKENLGGSALEEIAFIYQRMNKKSDQTKIKALETMKELLLKKKESFFISLMPSWTVIHDKLMISEVDPAIHQGALEINKLILTKAKKAMKLNFRSFYPTWFLTLHDYFDSSSKKAQENLDLLIPEKEKQALGFYLCQDNFLAMISSYLTEPSSQFKEINIFLDEHDCERVHNRVMQLTLSALTTSLKLISNIQSTDLEPSEDGEDTTELDKQRYYDKVINLLDLKDTDGKNSNLISKLFEKTTMSALIRAKLASLFQILLELGLITGSSKNGFKLVKMFLFSIDLREPKLQEVLWKDGLITKCVEVAIENFASLDSGKLEKKLIKLMKAGGYGLGDIYYDGILKFVKELPIHAIDLSTLEAGDKIKDILKSTNKIVNKKAEFAKNVLMAYTKSLNLPEIKFIVAKHLDNLFEILSFFIFDQFFPLLEKIKGIDLSAPQYEKALKIQNTLVQTLEMTIAGLLIVPLNIFIQDNNPQQKSLHVLGVNNPKFIPSAYLRFLDLISRTDNYKNCVDKNMTLVSNAFKNFSKTIQKTFKKNNKNFENFLFLIDSFGQKEISDPIINNVIGDLFDDCFNFATKFVKKELSHESCVEIEENFEDKKFNTFLVFLKNFLGSKNKITAKVCKKGVPKVFEAIVDNITSLIFEDFDMFDRQSVQIKIIKFLFECLHLLAFWYTENFEAGDATLTASLTKIDEVYKSIYEE